jgi:Mrp family chromosome partitioning ATPase
MTALNLAGALGPGSETPVLVIDADLRGPSVADYLQMGSASPGLVEAASRPDRSLLEVTQMHPRYNLAVLPAGHETDAPYEVLKSSHLTGLFDQARRYFQYIVVDAPPLLPYPDFRLIQKLVDGFFVVIGADRTPRKLVEESLRVVDKNKIVSLVFNGDKQGVGKYYSKRGKSYGRKR